MQAFRTPGLEEMWVACATKFGKSIAASCAIVMDGTILKQGVSRWVAPIYKQAKTIGMENVRSLLPPSPYIEEKKSENTLYQVKARNRFEFWHGQEPVSLEGAAVDLYVFDEAAKMKDGVYASARTTVTHKRSHGSGKFLGISTPLGRNWFYKKCMEAQLEMERAAKEKRLPKQIFITAPTSANPYIDPSVIEDARRRLPDRLFRQYYLAEFLDDAAVFSGYRQIISGNPIEFDGGFQLWIDDDSRSSEDIVIGVDWARTVDYTVFVAIDYSKDKPKVCGFCRFHGKNYVEAVKNLVLFTRKFQDVTMIYHDKTGVGVAIDDLLSNTELVFQGIVFTNSSKAEMVTKLITSIEHQKFLIPNIQVLLHEMDVYEMETTSIGNMTFKATEGEHDDCVSALMLAHICMLQYIDSDNDIKFLDELINIKSLDISGFDLDNSDELEESGYTIN